VSESVIYNGNGEVFSVVTADKIVRNDNLIQNIAGPTQAPFQVNPFGFPQLANYPGAPTISNINGLYDNMRWYLISNFWQVLSQGYAEIGLIKTLCQVPVDDAFMGGIEIFTEQLDEDDIKRLLASLDEHEDFKVLKETGYWDRLYGGAATIFMPDDQDPETPFDINSIKKGSDVEFRAVDLWELFWDYTQSSEFEEGQPLGSYDFPFYSYWGVKIHKSRVFKMTGVQAPSYLRPRLRGWGLSCIEPMVRPLNQYLKIQDLTYEILDEFKLDVYKLKGLASALQNPAMLQSLYKRMENANGRKNYMHATVLDKEDDFVQRQLSFTGIGEVFEQNRKQLQADTRIPGNKLFGEGASGFSSGQDVIETYNGMIESEIRPKQKRNMIWVVKIRCQQLFGFVPDDLEVKFKPLRILSASDEQNIKTAKYAILSSARASGDISREQFLEGCNKENLFPIQMEATPLTPDDLPAGMKPEETPEGGEVGKGGTKPAPHTAPEAKEPKAKEANALFTKIKNMINEFTKKNAQVDLQTNPRTDMPDEDSMADYETAGADSWIPQGEQWQRFHAVHNGPEWEKAKEASQAAFGKIKWPFVMWFYERHGGK